MRIAEEQLRAVGDGIAHAQPRADLALRFINLIIRKDIEQFLLHRILEHLTGLQENVHPQADIGDEAAVFHLILNITRELLRRSLVETPKNTVLRI